MTQGLQKVAYGIHKEKSYRWVKGIIRGSVIDPETSAARLKKYLAWCCKTYSSGIWKRQHELLPLIRYLHSKGLCLNLVPKFPEEEPSAFPDDSSSSGYESAEEPTPTVVAQPVASASTQAAQPASSSSTQAAQPAARSTTQVGTDTLDELILDLLRIRFRN